jgi:hypothetical protein
MHRVVMWLRHNGVSPQQWHTAGWGFTPLPKFRSFEKAQPDSQFLGIYVCNNLIRIQVLLICKLSRTPD